MQHCKSTILQFKKFKKKQHFNESKKKKTLWLVSNFKVWIQETNFEIEKNTCDPYNLLYCMFLKTIIK